MTTTTTTTVTLDDIVNRLSSIHNREGLDIRLGAVRERLLILRDEGRGRPRVDDLAETIRNYQTAVQGHRMLDFGITNTRRWLVSLSRDLGRVSGYNESIAANGWMVGDVELKVLGEALASHVEALIDVTAGVWG